MASVTGAQTLLRALDILDAFAEEGASLTLADLGRRAGLDRADDAPACEGARLARLPRHRREPPLQPRPRGDAPGLGRDAPHRRPGRALDADARAAARADRRDGEPALPARQRAHLRGRARQPGADPHAVDVGRTYPIHAGAAGKAILAWQPDVLDRPRLGSSQVAPATITDAAKLAASWSGSASAATPRASRRRCPAPRRSPSRCSAGRAAVLAAVNVAGPAMAGTAPSAGSSATPSSPRSPR